MTRSTSTKSFEEVYKTAYSHGLENIYALENVDIKTVRPLSSPPQKTKAKKKPLQRSRNNHAQGIFNFGLAYKGSVEPFALKEPLQVLGLNRYIESALLGQGKRRLEDLIALENVGFGQGHLDEIQNKLLEYLDGRHQNTTSRVDFISWLRSLTGDIDKKKLYVTLEPYNLQHLIPLTTGETLEVRRLTLEKRLEWREQADNALKSESKRAQIDKDFYEVTEVFIKPWIDSRLGLATEHEIIERLQALDENSEVLAILNFFQETYFKGVFPLSRYLQPLEFDLFASDTWTVKQYHQIVEKALTYFYMPHISYPYEALSSFIEREFARSWSGFRDGFLVKVLKTCPRFFVHKNHSGILQIALA